MECDIVILGGGPGGYVAAIQAAKLGAQVVLVEKDTVGGTCLNRGCIPTKAMARLAEIYNNLKNAEDFGCFAENIGIEVKKVVSRKNRIVNQLVQGIHHLLDRHNVKLISGQGEIRNQETVFVKKNMEETTIKTKNIIIATGSASSLLNIPGAGLENIITCGQAMQLEELPRKLVIIGGGVIAWSLPSFLPISV
ncbi:Pyridine nucleotide-disulphide oxidoreductase [Desulfotomaculum arcticum]|uniref:Pyridine nucleotide-disulphide oxidoreductase n=1 Tax=Desulfotruncus arcticus DSM 17038 TaxID=1121424 RepID=A0A1I2Y2F6_9FIRM|nr:Pyridine nucleotide-disulphide oxidoreductase [Desulfotomaculum arcticum] [Desulfotruncus arcticus DSM 17038]